MSEKKTYQKTEKKALEYVKKEYIKTRTLPGAWYLSSYTYKFDITHMQPFLKKLKDKKLIGNRCSGCNRIFFPPRLVCGQCLVKPDRWVDIRETANVATYAIAYLKNPDTSEVEEKPMVLVQHDGANTCCIAQMAPNVNVKDMYINMPLKVHWKDERTGGLMDIEYYDVIEDASKDLSSKKE